MRKPRWQMVVLVACVLAVLGVVYQVIWSRLSTPTPIKNAGVWVPIERPALPEPPATGPKVVPATAPAEEPEPPPAPLDLDVKEIEQLIAALGGNEFAGREHALERLKALGPAGVPVLQRYADHDDPEVATRVKALVGTFEWMNRGAIVLKVEFGS